MSLWDYFFQRDLIKSSFLHTCFQHQRKLNFLIHYLKYISYPFKYYVDTKLYDIFENFEH